MKSSSAQTDRLITASTEQAQATAQSVQAFIDSERGQLFIGAITLNKNGPTDSHPTIGYSFINLGHSPVVVTSVLIQCAIVTSVPDVPVYDKTKESDGQFTLGSNASVTNDGSATNGGQVALHACSLSSPLTFMDWNKISLKGDEFFFSGYIRYRDDFHSYVWYFGDIYDEKIQNFAVEPWLPVAYNKEVQQNQ